jgi:nitrate reductase gamma subunit
MYDFSRGPLVWIALSVFFFGSLIKLVLIILQAKKDKVVHPYWNLKFGTRSLIHWMIPYGSVNMRKRPLFTALSFLFHLCLLMTPIFALGHVMLWNESWGISWWTLPDGVTNLMTFVVIITGVIFILRRIADPTVRYVTSWKEYMLVILAIAPYLTGLMAYYQIFDYDTVIVIHMWTGALWLIAIPFTWLSHMFYFPFTRSYMGSEFGYVRNAKDW